MYYIVLTLHVTACLLMILVVLLQTGRGAGLMVFGGGGDSLINTPSGSTFMKKFTAGLACTFAFTSLLLTLITSRSGMRSVATRVNAEIPAPPAPAGAAPSAPAAPIQLESPEPAKPAAKPAAKKK